jgi:hypothetical protein
MFVQIQYQAPASMQARCNCSLKNILIAGPIPGVWKEELIQSGILTANLEPADLSRPGRGEEGSDSSFEAASYVDSIE